MGEKEGIMPRDISLLDEIPSAEYRRISETLMANCGSCGEPVTVRRSETDLELWCPHCRYEVFPTKGRPARKHVDGFPGRFEGERYAKGG